MMRGEEDEQERRGARAGTNYKEIADKAMLDSYPAKRDVAWLREMERRNDGIRERLDDIALGARAALEKVLEIAELQQLPDLFKDQILAMLADDGP